MVLEVLEEHRGQDVVVMMEQEMMVALDKLGSLEEKVVVGVNKELKVEVMEALVDNQVEQ